VVSFFHETLPGFLTTQNLEDSLRWAVIAMTRTPYALYWQHLFNGIGVRSPAEAKNSSSVLCVQTSSEARPASYPIGTGVLSLGVKRGRGVTLTTHRPLVPRSRMSRNYTSSPPCRLHGDSGTAYLFSNGSANSPCRGVCHFRVLRYKSDISHFRHSMVRQEFSLPVY
jgi:hypothetical protein